ncbi:hemolysin family protein [Litorihabitans aurantiacus]|uniref:Membrane protein n=1 Tax=Litorihabitans aurantiacus TaxID=1930061 RepID=A0AA38CTW0_9MICO|nr:hemolysin family protein [Litorihabitans aurantiacus]GMA33041.1 membrane protein [Litorihabitans aurantiacus]
MLSDVLLLVLGIVLILVIIAANGYFVAQEFAYMSVDRSTLRARAASGDGRAQRALEVTRRTSFMLSGAQLGITVTGLLVGYVAEPLVGGSLADLIGVAGAIGVITLVVLLLSVVVQMIFGELFPKNLAIANPEPMALALARSTLIYLAVMGWLITLFDKASNALLRLLRVEPVHDVDSSASAEDLGHIIDDSRASGDLPDDLSLMLDRILDFPEREVDHAMIPRVRTDVVTSETTVAEVRRLMAAAHTRYPVVDERFEPIGVVDLVRVLGCDAEDERPVTAIMREPLVLPTAMKLPVALAELQSSRNELACVIDEYGGFVGLLTIEDLTEELTGDITDEHDPTDVEREIEGVTQESDTSWLVDGEAHLDEIERTIGHDLPRGDYETVAGLLIDMREGLPDVGETQRVDLPIVGEDLLEENPVRRFAVVETIEVDRHVPSRVRLTLHEEALDGGDTGTPPGEPATDEAERPRTEHQPEERS